MPCEYQIDGERRLVKVRAWGVFTHSEVMETRAKFTADPSFCRDFFQLYDMREVTDVPTSSDSVRELAIDHVFGPGSRRAVVATHPVAYGYSRMFATYREINGGKEEIRVFHTIGEAEGWLGVGPLVARQHHASDAMG